MFSSDVVPSKYKDCRVAILTSTSGDRLLVPLDVQALAQTWPNIACHLADLEPSASVVVVERTTDASVSVLRPATDYEYGEIARSLIAWYEVTSPPRSRIACR